MGFSDPITAGDILIRPAIQSPNYVAGTTGWTINRDGTAEFTGLTINQGSLFLYDTTPILRLKIASTPTPAATFYDATGAQRMQLIADTTGSIFFNSLNGSETAPARLRCFTQSGYGRLELVGPELGGFAAGAVTIDSQDIAVTSAVHSGNVTLEAPAGRVLAPSELRSRRASTTDPALTSVVGSESNERFRITGGGDMNWGGGSAATDCDLYRAAATVLETQSNFNVMGLIGSKRGASTDLALTSKVQGESNDRLQIVANGGLSWGSGSAATDCNLYRASATVLETQSSFNLLGGNLGVKSNGQINLDSGSWIHRGGIGGPTLLNGWSNFGGGYENAGYIEYPDKTAGLVGVISAGTTTSGTVLFTIPAGIRPSAHHVFLAPGSAGTNAQVAVESGGNVKIQSPVGTPTWISISVCRWPMNGF